MGNCVGQLSAFHPFSRRQEKAMNRKDLSRIFFCFKLILALPESVLEYYWIKTFAPAPKLFTAAAAACVEFWPKLSLAQLLFFPC
jgi:hypothetical protein